MVSQQQRFSAQIRECFGSYLHSNDSDQVLQELSKLWPDKFTNPVQELNQKLEFGKIKLPSISCIKYISRRHGLPKNLIDTFLSILGLDDGKSAFLKYQIAQSLKYAIEKDEASLDFSLLLSALQDVMNFQKRGEVDVKHGLESYSKSTLSQLVEAVALKLNPDNCDFNHNEKPENTENWIVSQIKPYFPCIDSRTKAMFLEKVEKLGIHSREKATGNSPTSVSSNLAGIDLTVETKGFVGVKPYQNGTEVLGRCSQFSRKVCQLKADAVKTQQTVTSVFKENVSEKTEIENISLANALNSSRSTGKQQESNSDVTLTPLSNSGSTVRGWFTTTAQNIDRLLLRAQTPSLTICEDDLKYLKSCLCGWKTSFFETNATMNTNAAIALSLVSERQIISVEIQNDIVEAVFITSPSFCEFINAGRAINLVVPTFLLLATATTPITQTCRIKVLKTLQNCAARNSGKIPKKSEEILLAFRKTDECNDELKKMLWKIFRKNDNNLYEAFEIALEEILMKTEEQASSTLSEILEYIHEQVCDEERALNLEQRFNYFSTFLTIISGEMGHPAVIRAKISQILHDFLAHSKAPSLNGNQISKVLRLYKEVVNDDIGECTSEIKTLFQSSLIYCILETINKPSFEVSDLPAELLDLLVGVALDDTDEKLGIMSLISLGNLVIKDPNLKIPRPFGLAHKLTQNAGVDQDGVIYLKTSGSDEQVADISYCSEMAAHILLEALKQKKDDLDLVPDSVFEEMAQALDKCRDKNTRILCSEALFLASQHRIKNFSTDVLWTLQEMTSDAVADIRIYSTATYCSSIARILTGSEVPDFPFSSTDMDNLSSFFALDKLILENTDFSKIVNSSILNVLYAMAPRLPLSHQIFQLLATLLNSWQDHDIERNDTVLDIISIHLESNLTNGLPDYLLDALENLVVREKKLFKKCLNIFTSISEKYGQELSRVVIDVLFKKLEVAETQTAILKALLIALSVQDLPDSVFRRFDLEFACRRLLENFNGSNSSHQFELEMHFAPKKKTGTYKTNLLKTVKKYFATGMKLTPLNFELLKACIQHRLSIETTVECIALSAENGQILPKDIIELVLDNKLGLEISMDVQLRLALALVQTYQTLPLEFQNVILPKFLKSPFHKIFAAEKEYSQIFTILTKSIQNTQVMSQLPAIVKKMCQGWQKESGGSHRQRLEILASLSSLVNCGESLGELDGDELKTVFLQAITENNPQILETGLHGFIALNTRVQLSSKSKEGFCDSSDIKLLVQIQRDPATNPSVNDIITEFLTSKMKQLSPSLKAFINLSNIGEKTNSEFVKDLPTQLEWGHKEFFDTEACQNRFREIFDNETDEKILTTSIYIILKYESNSLPAATLESIAFAMVNHSDFTEFKNTCNQVLAVAIEKGINISQNFVKYLEVDTQLNSRLLMKLMSKVKTQAALSKELQASLKIEQLLDQKKLKASLLDNILKDIPSPILPPDIFQKLLQQDFIQAGISLNIVQMIAVNLCSSDTSYSNELNTKLVKILDKCIINHEEKTSKPILQAFVPTLCKECILTNPKKTVNALVNIWNNSKQASLDQHCLILNLFGEIFKSVSFTKPYVKSKVITLLIEQIRNPIPMIRKFSIKAIRLLQPECLKSEKGSLDNKVIQNQIDTIFDLLASHAFKEIFYGESPERIEAEMNIDPEFTFELTELLVSLQSINLERLREVREDRSKWKRLLILSDFLETAVQSLDEQLEFYKFAIQFYDKASNDLQAHDLFSWLSLALNHIERSSIPVLFKSLLQIKPHEIFKVLSNRGKSLMQEVSKIVLNDIIQGRLKYKLNPKLVESITYRLILILGANVAQALVESLETINNIDGLETILNVISEIANSTQINKLAAHLKPYLKENTIPTVEELRIIIEGQILLMSIPSKSTRRPRIQRMLTTLLRNGIKMQEISQLIQLTLPKTSQSTVKQQTQDDALKALDHALSQSCQYRVNSAFFSKLVLEMSKSDKSKHFIQVINTHFRDGVFDGKSGVKDIHQVVHEFRLHNSRVSYKWSCIREKFIKAGYEWDLLKMKLLQVLKADTRSKIMPTEEFICDWRIEQIQTWSFEAKKRASTQFASLGLPVPVPVLTPTLPAIAKSMDQHEFYNEALTVCSVALKRLRNFNMTKVQALSCYVVLLKLDKDKMKGQLQQVATGSGKSAIIAIISVVKALDGHSVDIYTSSPVLAERDAKEWQPFYEIFGLQASHNADIGSSYISGVKPCYTRNIVYGDASQFQFDYLRDKYSHLGTLAGRNQDFAIVDEVDSMLLDDSTKLARLSTTLPGMDILEVIYHFLWDRLFYLQSHLHSLKDNTFYMEGQVSRGQDGLVVYKVADAKTNELMKVDDLNSFIHQATDEDLAKARIFPVDKIEDYIKEQLAEYVSALVGENSGKIKIPKHLEAFVKAQTPLWVESALTALSFQEDVHYIVSDGIIKPVDYRTTGIVQSSTNWNNGLHQFLGLKHSLKISPETVTTNFLSNLSMLSKYKTNLVGFTGTLGSSAGRELLYNVYNVKLLTLPETNFKRYVQFPDILVPNEEQWCREVVISCMAERSKGRGVLIICETIQKATTLSSVLSTLKVRVKLYTKNEEDQERHIEQIHPGDIIVATNLAGRGTDINTNEIEDNGGLHVCLTFLPHSSRIEEQAFGRTSRQGRKGTGQLIIVEDPEALKFKVDRDVKEMNELENFRTSQLPPIRRKGQVFEKFCNYFGTVRSRLREEVNAEKGLIETIRDGTVDAWNYATGNNWTPPSLYETLVLQSIEERWAMFLHRVEDKELDETETMVQYNLLEQEIKAQLAVSSLEVLRKGQNTFYFTQLGNEEYRRAKTEKARDYFELALCIDSDFGTGAHVGMGAVLLKSGKPTNYKEKAIEHLTNAQLLLNTEMAWITVQQTLIQRKLLAGDDIASPLMEQLTEKASLLGQIINTVEANVEAVQKSLRRVHCVGIKDQRKELVQIPNQITELPKNKRLLTQAYKRFDTFSISFHNLTARVDTVTKDQAVDTLPDQALFNWKTKKAKVGLRSKALSLKKLLQHEKIKLLEEVPEISIELSALQIDKEKLLFKFESLKVHPKSFDLELTCESEIIKEIFQKLFKSGHLKNLELQWVSESSEFQASITVFEMHSTAKIDESIEEKIANTDNLISIKLLHLSQEDIASIIKALPTTKNPPSVNLTLNSIQGESAKSKDLKATQNTKAMLIETWDQLLANYKNTIYLRQMSSANAKNVIPILREMNVDFILDVYDLDLNAVTNVLNKANIEQENMEQTKLQELSDLFMSGRLPFQEIQELNARGLSILVLFNEKQFVPWTSICIMCAMASAQVAVGGLLITTGFGASLGMSLVSEGMSDFTTAYRAYSTRQFSWSDYRNQKAVSLIISATTMGLNNLRNGAKGVKLMTGMSKLTTDASANALKTTGQNLTTLTGQYIVARGTETAARVVLKTALDKLTGFCFEQLRDSITHEVSIRVEFEFLQKNLNRELSRRWAIQGYLQKNPKPNSESRLLKTVEGAVRATTNPRATTLSSFWDSVGGPLANNLLSGSDLVGSSWNNIVLTIGAINGLKQIESAVSRVCSAIETRLSEEPDPLTEILRKANISQETTAKVVKVLNFNKDGTRGFDPVSMPLKSLFQNDKEYKAFQDVLDNLNNTQQKFDCKNSERSRIEKSVVDLITSHIIRVANSYLVSPVMSKLAGSLIKSISNDLQELFLTNSETGESGTLEGRIKENAQTHMTIYSKMERIEALDRMRENLMNGDGNKHEKPSVEVLKLYDDVVNDAPLSSDMITNMAKSNNLNIKITSDPNLQLTEAERASGMRIILYTGPPSGSPAGTPGHFQLRKEDGSGFEFIPSNDKNNNNCGVNIISQLLADQGVSKSADELRTEIGQQIVNSPEDAKLLVENAKWFERNRGRDTTDILQIGGARKDRIEETSRDMTPTEKKNKGAGFIYILKPKNEPEGKYKIGMTKDEPGHRVMQLTSNNKEEYEVLEVVPTAYRYSTETMIHDNLSHVREPRGTGDGSTEYFRGDLQDLLRVVNQTNADVETRHGPAYKPDTLDDIYDQYKDD